VRIFVVDEIQTGLGRTGELLAVDHERIKPDGIILGKALGGGLLPVSMFLARKDVMDVFTPGDHGSTFGGNPLAAAVGLEALNVLVEDNLARHSAELGLYMLNQLRAIQSPVIREVRGKGLFIGLEVNPEHITAHQLCLKLMEHGILSKDTHHTVVRFAPPLVITQAQIDEALEKIRAVLNKV
jgi:ornithine--oxo-acid transaminase